MTSGLYGGCAQWGEDRAPTTVTWDERIILGSKDFAADHTPDRRARILLVGHSCDPDLARIATLLRRAGALVHAILVDRIGRQPSLMFPSSEDRPHYDVGYCRGYQPAQFVHFHYDRTLRRDQGWHRIVPDLREHATGQAETLLWGWLAWVAVDRWVNSPWQVRVAENKMAQLGAAERAGLAIPATLVTDRADELRQFARDAPMGVVHKSLSSPVISSSGSQHSFLYTSTISAEDIDALPYPCLFQRRLQPRAEYRVTLIGARTFATALHRSGGEPADWRRAADDHARFDHHRLDDALADALRRLMEALDIQVGAADLIDNGDDTYFLEINPSAALLWLERTLGMQLCQSVTNLILCGT